MSCTFHIDITHIEGVLGGTIQCNLLYLRPLLVTLVVHHKDIEGVDALAPPMEGQAQHMQLARHANGAQPPWWLQGRTWNFTYLQTGTVQSDSWNLFLLLPGWSRSGREDVSRRHKHHHMVMPEACC